eukprot:gnl/Hemi2/20005_TR6633_c0_g1_i1.p2 gnl/Hemi2/20005_TR6633_c0_g1~~gnl/Hemi2/20005_TR6633_c0_g1_i1.p2  ORF type:complete len:255 (+),score=73.42 gnl/Hemi2/20005_TR6633_c0_g1_i1:80-844(+)
MQRAVSTLGSSFRAYGKPSVVFVLGGPGSGKGTQCAKLVKEFSFLHLSAGDLLRAEISSGSPNGAMISDTIASGRIVPVEVTLNLLRDAIRNSGRDKVLVDGFPRNLDNLLGWNALMRDETTVPFALFLNCPAQILQSRLILRGRTSGRSDDNSDAIRLRFVTHENESLPVIRALHAEGRIREINADQGEGDVWRDVQAVIRKEFSSQEFSTDFANCKQRPSLVAPAPPGLFVAGGDGGGTGSTRRAAASSVLL